MTNPIEFLLRVRNEASAPLRDVADAAEEAGDAAKKAAKEIDDFGDASGKVGSNAGKMAGALSLVPGPAGEAARTVADLADVGEVASEAAKALGLSLRTVLGVLGPVAVAVALLTVAYNHYSAELEEAEAKQKAAADEAERAQRIYGDLKTSVQELDDEYQVATGQMSEAALKARQGQEAVEDFYREPLALQQESIDATKREIAERQKNYHLLVREEGSRDAVAKKTNDLTEKLGKQEEAYRQLTANRDADLDKVDAIVAALVREQQERERQRKALEKQREEERRAADTKKLLASVSDIAARGLDEEGQAAFDYQKKVKALKDEADRLKVSHEELHPALARLKEEFEDTVHALQLQEAYADAALWAEAEFAPALDKSAEAARKFAESMKGLVPEETLSDMERLSLAAADLALQLSRGEIDQATFDARMGEVEGASESSNLGGMASTAAGVMGVVQGGVGGATSAIAGAGPIGMIVAAVIGLLQAIGDGLLEDMHAEVMGLFETIGDLGSILGDFIVSTLREGIPALFDAIPDLLSGLIDAVPEIIEASIEMAIKSVGEIVALLARELPKIAVQLTMMLLDPEFWKGIGAAFFDAVTEAFDQAWSAIREGFNALFDPATWSAMVEFFVRLLGSIWDGIVGTFDTLFSAETWQNIGKWIADAIASIFKPKEDNPTIFQGEWWERAASDTGNWFDQAGKDLSSWFSGGFANGGYVDRTGLALVHQGERVIPPTGTGSMTATLGRALGGGGSGITVNVTGGIISPSVVNEIVRELNRHLGAGNRGLLLAG